ncbi:6706_t:CDS:2 [Diversispora eburnea]|uniref:6706_t:CDS:1 n=1 Tax=Diversispora eburnea TaxID=1213867 RepID=A0A9N8ZT67_9GLOM|nr:6706_t:CDS:2 [Diversispora eburnea]
MDAIPIITTSQSDANNLVEAMSSQTLHQQIWYATPDVEIVVEKTLCKYLGSILIIKRE